MKDVIYRMTNRKTAERTCRMCDGIAAVIEKEPDCTYEDVMYVLDSMKNNYLTKGNNLLNSTSIQKVAEFGGLLE